MNNFYPHQIFLIESAKMLIEATRQECINVANIGELEIVEGFFNYLHDHARPMMLNDDWVFAAVVQFATDYRQACFDSWERTGSQATRMKDEKDRYDREVKDFTEKAYQRHQALRLEEGKDRIFFRKGSDFYEHLQLERLPSKMRSEAKYLHKNVSDFERRYLKIIVENIREDYEILLPRIMFVIRRVVKVERNLPSKPSYNRLLDMSKNLGWYNTNIDKLHPLHPVLGFLENFYKVARNVASHVRGMEWKSHADDVHLPDDRNPQTVDMYELTQRYRYLVNLCEMGMSTILAAYCEREKDLLAAAIAEDYIAMIGRADPKHPIYGVDASKIRVKPYND